MRSIRWNDFNPSLNPSPEKDRNAQTLTPDCLGRDAACCVSTIIKSGFVSAGKCPPYVNYLFDCKNHDPTNSVGVGRDPIQPSIKRLKETKPIKVHRICLGRDAACCVSTIIESDFVSAGMCPPYVWSDTSLNPSPAKFAGEGRKPFNQSTHQLLVFPQQPVIIIASIQPGDNCSPFQRTGTGEIRYPLQIHPGRPHGQDSPAGLIA